MIGIIDDNSQRLLGVFLTSLEDAKPEWKRLAKLLALLMLFMSTGFAENVTNS